MSPDAWAVLAAIFAVLCEYLYRVLPGPWWSYLPLWVPLQTFIGYCVYRIVTAPHTTLLDAFVLWSATTLGLRVILSIFVLHDAVKPQTWLALGFVIAARVIQRW